ncbi:MAG: hypothetical protein DHS20C01_03580 [marine bacterium B5-7]|nr:MAG: hypothetical protein DHS20C01_03580 [marine bacterium B5-7]
METQQSESSATLTARSLTRTSAVTANEWNAFLNDDDAPFLKHEFLSLLEDSGCVGPGTGWTPCHLVIEQAGDKAPAGIVPLYLKEHSYGEYVFDWAWANAYQQHDIAYYPKLVSGIPFTPVTTRKLLAPQPATHVKRALIKALQVFAQANPISSIHALFLDTMDSSLFENAGYLTRKDHQFHWNNEGYVDFDHYLSAFTSKRRKTIRAERRQVRDAGVEFCWLSAEESREADWVMMYQSYRNTIAEHGGYPYLTETFFLQLPNRLPRNVWLLRGAIDGKVICNALYFTSAKSLYGRYWGASQYVPCLHFETCYYQPIAFAIEHQLATFEAGAQGIHKLSRGLAPTVTQSAHWLKHPGFYDAVDRYLQEERREQGQYTRLLNESLPFRKSGC